MADWLVSIGRAIDEQHTFKMYVEHLQTLPNKEVLYDNYTMVSVPQWDGMRIVERFLLNEGFNDDDGV